VRVREGVWQIVHVVNETDAPEQVNRNNQCERESSSIDVGW
jgi:hypothetical protein